MGTEGTGGADWEPGRREWLALLVLAIPAFIVGLDMTVLHLAVAELSAELEPSSSELLWIVDSYGFMVAGFLITMGTLGDRIGRRRLLLIGMSGFIAFSVLASLADSAEGLIAARALLGVCGATIAPSTIALIRTVFVTDQHRLVAISVWAVAWFGGMAVGPIASGLVIELSSWSSVFLIAVPFLLPLLVLAGPLLPEAKDPDAGRIDFASVALSLLGVVAVIYGFKHAAEDGLDAVTAGTLLVGVSLVALFVRRQAVLEHPLLDLAMLRNQKVAAALSTQTIAVIALGGTQFFIAQYLQLVLGYSALEAGAWLILPTVAGILSTFLGPTLAQRFRPASVIAGGMLVAGVALASLVALAATESLLLGLVGYGLLWVGLGPMFALCADLIVGAAPEEKAGSAGALSETGNEFGFALGIGMLATAGIALYRRGVEVPPGLGEREREAAVDSLGGAIAVADGLPADVGGALLASGNAAFSDGMALSAGIGSVLCLAGALWVSFALRDRSGPEADEDRPRVGQPAAGD